MATAKQWEKYLRECEYVPGDQVMYRSYECEVFISDFQGSTDGVAETFANDKDTPLRIFTPDGRTQKGKDYVPSPSKRERVAAEILRWYDASSGWGCGPLADTILKICEVEDDL